MKRFPVTSVKSTRVVLAAFLLLLAGTAVFFSYTGAYENEVRQTPCIRIAIPAGHNVLNYEDNYYKKWLEEKSGCTIEFQIIKDNFTREYLHSLLSLESDRIDAVFFSSNEKDEVTAELLNEYGEKGYICPLNELIERSGIYTKQALEQYVRYRVEERMQTKDGMLYYFPNMNPSKASQNAQVLWINTDLLRELQISIPQTTEEFYEVLKKFIENGKLPLAGAADSYDLQSYNFLLNSFTYNDPENSRIMVGQEGLVFTPVTEEFREGLMYCAALYREGLLGEQNFTGTREQLAQLASDKRQLIGAFTSQSIGDVLYQNSPEVRSGYLYIEPLLGPEGSRYAVAKAVEVLPGAIIPANSKNPEHTFTVLDLMLSKEASLIAKYGEPGVDWSYANENNLSIYESKAKINTHTYLWGKTQNKHLGGYGPFVVAQEYLDAVTWNGYNADQEYINARAMKNYLFCWPPRYPEVLYTLHWNTPSVEEKRKKIDAYTDEMITAFITGKKDIYSDVHWQTFVQEYDRLQLPELLEELTIKPPK